MSGRWSSAAKAVELIAPEDTAGALPLTRGTRSPRSILGIIQVIAGRGRVGGETSTVVVMRTVVVMVEVATDADASATMSTTALPIRVAALAPLTTVTVVVAIETAPAPAVIVIVVLIVMVAILGPDRRLGLIGLWARERCGLVPFGRLVALHAAAADRQSACETGGCEKCARLAEERQNP